MALLEEAGLRVHGRLVQLFRRHFAQTFESGNRDILLVFDFGHDLVLFVFVEQVAFLLANLEFVQRRHGEVNMACVNQRAHVAEEEREEKRLDVRAVHISIGHDDDFVVAELFNLEFRADASTDSVHPPGSGFLRCRARDGGLPFRRSKSYRGSGGLPGIHGYGPSLQNHLQSHLPR